MVRRLLVTAFAAASIAGLGAASPASAHCVVNAGYCGPGGHCAVNTGNCSGHCYVNVGTCTTRLLICQFEEECVGVPVD